MNAEYTDEELRVKIAEKCGWRRWQFGDPYLKGLRLADQKFNGYVRIVTHVYPNGITLDVDESPLYRFNQIHQEFIPCNFWLSPKQKWWKNLPNYVNDLNAMHEAVSSLNREELRRYRCVLQQTFEDWDTSEGADSCIDATARKRAVAFVRALSNG